MKAAIFKGVGLPLVIEDVPIPDPGRDGVVFKVGRCGICSSDLHYTDGHSESLSFKPGDMLGHEVGGEVVAVGPEVTRFRPGDKIASMYMAGCGVCSFCINGRPLFCASKRPMTGGYAEYALGYENGLIRLPNSLSLADGALIEPLAVALHGVRQCPIVPGSRVLVLGAGPIGLGAIFWARKMGATQIAVSEINRNREELAHLMGADHFLVAGESGRPLPNLACESLGGAPNIVLECVGIPGMLKQAIDCVQPAGTIGIIGYCMTPDSFVPAEAMHKEARMVFALTYNLGEYEHVARILDGGSIEPRAFITDTISLSALPARFEALRIPNSDIKVQVDPWQ